MRQKLLPCPFCWSSASLETGVTANIGGEEIQYVTCVECSAQADPHDWQTRPEAASHGQQAMTDAEIEQWIKACNHEPARETLRHYLALRYPSPQPNVVGDDTRRTFIVPDGHYAVLDQAGRATGEIRPLPASPPSTLTGELVTVNGQQLRRFIRYPEPVDDGTLRCICCGQIDEQPYHDDHICIAASGSFKP